MTVTTRTNKILYTGDGVQTVFPYNFEIQKDSDLQVFLDNVLQGAGFTITGAGDPGGGDVTFDVAPADLVEVFLLREVPMTQEVDYQPYGPFPAETHEGALDKLTMLVQQLQEQLTRVILEPLPGDPDVSLQLPPPIPLYILGWDALGENIVNFEQGTIAGGQITAALYDLIVNPLLVGGEFNVSAAFGNVFGIALTEDALLTTSDWPSALNFQAITILVTATGGPWTLSFEANVVGRDGTTGTLPDTTALATGKTMTITMAMLPNGLIVCDTYATNAGV